MRVELRVGLWAVIAGVVVQSAACAARRGSGVVPPDAPVARPAVGNRVVRGVVVHDGTRAPAGFAAVFAQRDDDAGLGRQVPSATADSAGRFAMEGLDPGEYDFVARLGGEVGITGRSVFVIEGSAWDSVEIAVSPASTLLGVVQTASGEPVSDASVSVVRTGDLQWASTVRTGSNGSFTMDGLFPGSYSASVNSRGIASVFDRVPVEGAARATFVVTSRSGPKPRTDRVDFRQRPVSDGIRLPWRAVVIGSGGGIAGAGVDDTGAPARDFEVTLADATAPFKHGEKRRVVHGTTGLFAFDALPAGDYRLTAETPEGLVASANIRVSPPARAAVTLRFGEGIRLRGRVVHLGSPMQARVRIRAWDARDWRDSTTGPDGSFEIPHLVPSRDALIAIEPSKGKAYFRSLDLKGSDGSVDDLGALSDEPKR